MFFSEFLKHPELKKAFGSRPDNFSRELRRFGELPYRKPGRGGDGVVTADEAAKLICTLCAATSVANIPNAIELYNSKGHDTPTILDLVKKAIQEGTADFEQIDFELNQERCYIIWASDIGHFSKIERNPDRINPNGRLVPSEHKPRSSDNFIAVRIMKSRFLELLHHEINPTSAKPKH